MLSLLKKEIVGFLGSLIGYIVIGVFLVTVGLLLWVLPGNNILDGDYAGIDSLFIIAPWVFLFLIPAVTMRSFAEEKKAGTLELLLTRPLTDLEIIIAKFLACMVLVIIALIPTIIYYISVYNLGSPPGDIDEGRTWGSYLGLMFLAGGFTAIGIFASSISSNQVISFILAVILCYVCYAGFSYAGSFISSGAVGIFVQNLSINMHYSSMSRGVIDTRDVVYFLSLVAAFVLMSRASLESRKKLELPKLGISIAILILLNYVCSFFFYRFDLTSERRYTLSAQSKDIAKNLTGTALFKVYLNGGKLPAGLIRLRDETKEMLDEFRAYSGGKIQYEFIDPTENPNENDRIAFYKQIYKQGLTPIGIQVNEQGGSSELTVVPGGILAYRGKEIAMEILHSEGNSRDPQEALNYSIEELEYDIDNAIHKLSIDIKPKIAFIQGHNELDSIHTASAAKALREYYDVRSVTINHQLSSLKDYKAIIVAKPDSAYDEQDKFIIDQYIMHGGKVLWCIDPLYAPMDSLERNGMTIAFPNDLNLQDMFFNYGVRINANLVEDMQCSKIPINTAYEGEQPNFRPSDWIYNPLVGPTTGKSDDNPIVKNLNLVELNFASTIDTIAVKGIKKTILLTTSRYSKVVAAPVRISTSAAHIKPSEYQFKKPYQKVAVLLEGKFKSLYKGRIPVQLDTSKAIDFLGEGKPSAQIFISDGDVIRNEVAYKGMYAMPLGQDKYYPEIFSNKDFVVNCVNYLCGDSTLLYVRGRELQLRPLDAKKVNEQRTQWQVVNVGLPLVLIALLGLILAWRRKEKWAK